MPTIPQPFFNISMRFCVEAKGNGRDRTSFSWWSFVGRQCNYSCERVYLSGSVQIPSVMPNFFPRLIPKQHRLFVYGRVAFEVWYSRQCLWSKCWFRKGVGPCPSILVFHEHGQAIVSFTPRLTLPIAEILLRSTSEIRPVFMSNPGLQF